MNYSIISLLPPILIVIVACISQSVQKALASGIIFAALLVHKGNIITATQIILERTYNHLTDGDNIALYLFLITISSLIALFSKSNLIPIVTGQISKKIKNKRLVEITSVFSSLILSLDDYLSILTAGFIMKPLADKFEISRTRIAYFIHALSGPLVVLSPFSSWAATILLQLDNNGIHAEKQASTLILAEPFSLYLQMIPYFFYSILTIFSVIFIIVTQINPYQDTGKFDHYLNNTIDIQNPNNLGLQDVLIPLATLLVSILTGFLYMGNYWMFGGENNFIQALQDNRNTFFIMFLGALSSFLVAFIKIFLKKGIFAYQLPSIIKQGFYLIYGAIMMVTLASIFGSFVQKDLMTGAYIAHLIFNSVSLMFIPLIIFITSLLITLATGSAWGTFTLMIPIVIQMIMSLQNINPIVTPDTILLLFPCLGAIFSGSACGDNISLFSETTTMTASAVGITPFQHFYSQLFYAYPAIIATIFAYILCGLSLYFPILSNFYIILLLSSFLVIILFSVQKLLMTKNI